MRSFFETLLEDKQLCTELKLDPMAALKRFYEIPERGIQDKGKFFSHGLVNEAIVASGHWEGCSRISKSVVLGKIIFRDEQQTIIHSAPAFSLKEEKEEVVKNKIGAVASFNDYFELGGNIGFRKLKLKGFMSKRKIVTPAEWEKEDVEHFCIPMKDYEADVPVELLLLAHDKMNEYREKGKLIYVHCKSGKGRSLLGCVTDQAISELEEKFVKDATLFPENEDKAFIKRIEKNIQDKREQVSLGTAKENKAIETIRVAKSILAKKNLEAKESKEPISKKLDNNFLSSSLAKLDIAQMTFFKELAIYAAKEKTMAFGVTKRSKYIEDIFQLIYAAKNDDWFRDFDQHFRHFIAAKPSFKNKADAILRQTLVEGFKAELTTYKEIMSSHANRVLARDTAKAVSRSILQAGTIKINSKNSDIHDATSLTKYVSARNR